MNYNKQCALISDITDIISEKTGDYSWKVRSMVSKEVDAIVENFERKEKEAQKTNVSPNAIVISKKFDKAAIMSRAWEIAKNSAAKFGGKASEYIDESLRISWVMAKVDKLETKLFLLNMKDLSGGRRNVIAQIEIRNNEKKMDELEREINTLRAKIA